LRIWDVQPGYLNRQSLLGEHRELHGLYNILVLGKSGYSRHPETLRWVGCLSGLIMRHAALGAEMRLRGYSDRSPLPRGRRLRWPETFIDPPHHQFTLLASKYQGKEPGRIPLPRSPHELWAHHKYSVMARDPAAYRDIGRRVSRMRRGTSVSLLSDELVALLRQKPARPRIVNALEHMWGYVSKDAAPDELRIAQRSAAGLLLTTRQLAFRTAAPYLITSTALGELGIFVFAESA
jgi:hypothetical protein